MGGENAHAPKVKGAPLEENSSVIEAPVLSMGWAQDGGVTPTNISIEEVVGEEVAKEEMGKKSQKERYPNIYARDLSGMELLPEEKVFIQEEFKKLTSIASTLSAEAVGEESAKLLSEKMEEHMQKTLEKIAGRILDGAEAKSKGRAKESSRPAEFVYSDFELFRQARMVLLYMKRELGTGNVNKEQIALGEEIYKTIADDILIVDVDELKREFILSENAMKAVVSLYYEMFGYEESYRQALVALLDNDGFSPDSFLSFI